MHAALIGFTLLTICWSLWIRRFTWRCRGDVAANLNVALQGAAVALMSPFAARTVGLWIYRISGLHNMQNLIAHDTYLVAATSIIVDSLSRLGIDQGFKFRKYVQIPALLSIPVTVALFTRSSATQTFASDFFAARCDGWLSGYWIVLCATLIHFLGYAWRALIPLWRDRDWRPMALAYMASTGSGIAACVVRIAVSLAPAPVQESGWSAALVWVLATGCGLGFAATSARDWTLRVRAVYPVLV